ncbi:MAG: DNA polymerase III subunit chi [Pseudomonadota bacterium]
MAEVRFYHLTATTLESALPKLLEKTLERGKRAVVLARSEERVEALCSHLWSYNDRSFLPHGTRRDGFAEQQPIWLSERDENPNDAQYLFLTDGAVSERMEAFELCALLFDGRDAEALQAARAEWKRCKDLPLDMTYWQQDEQGQWQKKQTG